MSHGWIAARRWSAVLGGGLALMLAGCANMERSNGDAPRASAMQHPTLEGIPVPRGFSFQPDRSFFAVSGSYRGGLHEFTGGTEPVAVYRFYQELMPQSGYSFKQGGLDRGEYSLRFDNDREECAIKLRRMGMQTVLSIRIDPIPRVSGARHSADAGPAAARARSEPDRPPAPAETNLNARIPIRRQ